MIIKPRIGFDNIVFGMRPEEVEKILGKPDRIYSTNEYDQIETYYVYNSLKLRLAFFKEHDNKLGYIETTNSKASYIEHTIIDQEIKNVLSLFAPLSKSGWSHEDYETFSVYSDDLNWIDFHVEFERVTQIELGVPFKNDNEYDWPKTKGASA